MDLNEEFIIKPDSESYISLALVRCDEVKQKYKKQNING